MTLEQLANVNFESPSIIRAQAVLPECRIEIIYLCLADRFKEQDRLRATDSWALVCDEESSIEIPEAWQVWSLNHRNHVEHKGEGRSLGEAIRNMLIERSSFAGDAYASSDREVSGQISGQVSDVEAAYIHTCTDALGGR